MPQRIEEYGWDSDDRIYYVLDDNRLYRRTDPPPPPPPQKAKAKPKPKSKGTRASKRRKLSSPESGEEEYVDGEDAAALPNADDEAEYDGLGGAKWECVAVTLSQYQDFLETLRRSKDPNEKMLRGRIIEHVLPALEQKAEAQRQKELKRQRELEVLQKMATAKRSSRLAGKLEKQKEAEETAAAERKHQEDLKMAHREQDKQKKMEEVCSNMILLTCTQLMYALGSRIAHADPRTTSKRA